ncbi:MAG TPA: protein phosphatase 2C domain-containing protein [Candidatus Dormibacteraeota bacterium]
MSQLDRSHEQIRARDGTTVLELAACSDKGPVRRDNQDAWAIRPLARRGAVVVLADGMGGHADGAIASHLAVTAATERLVADPDPGRALGEAVEEANQAIAERRRERRVLSGTTLVVAVVRDGRAVLANIGDSRAYLIRAGLARQVTQDHSWLADEMRAGRIPVASAAHDQRRNVLSRALTGDSVQADVFELELAGGDTLVLCCDGIWEALDDDALAALLAPGRPLADEVAEAVATAIRQGSTDNATVVACRLAGG